jgi:acyl-homoserine-lactone acylase
MNAQHWITAVLVCLLGIGPLSDSARSAAPEDYDAPPEGQVRVTRDAFGVPHLAARDFPSLFFGAGYAQAEDQLENIAQNYFRGQGRAAEFEGRSAVQVDHLVRMLRIPQRARQQYDELDPKNRSYLDAFAAGVNHYMQQHGDDAPDWIEPVTGDQILAFSMYIEPLFAAGHCRNDLDKAGIKLSGLESFDRWNDEPLGSNQIAIAPSRTTTGAAMLSMDPHLRHTGVYRWYEMHMCGPDLNIMGACFFGSPYVSMGRTERSAWCMTVNGPDLGDVFAFEVNKEDPQQYRDLKGWSKFETNEETYRVKSGDSFTQIKLPVRQTSVGPVVAVQDGVAYVFALPMEIDRDRASQQLEMARAQDVEQFKQALSRLGLVMFNIVYADVDGDIYYVSNGRVPKRDMRISSDAIRPGHEAWARWQGYHALEDLPQILNPRSGFVMNTNSGPQNVCPEAPQPADYPPYMMSQQDNSRSRRLFALLNGDSQIELDELKAYATDTHLEPADTWQPRLIEGIREHADGFGDDAELLKQVGKVLETWDGRTDVSSKGAVLFLSIVTNKDFHDAAGNGDIEAASKVIIEQAKAVQKRFGALDVAWGEYSRIRRGNIELPLAGNGAMSAQERAMNVTALRPSYGIPNKGRRYCVGGSSYGMIVDFSGKTSAVSCLPYGVSEDPDSPHFADQMPLYAEARFKPAWFWPEEVKANTESTQVLDYAAATKTP